MRSSCSLWGVLSCCGLFHKGGRLGFGSIARVLGTLPENISSLPGTPAGVVYRYERVAICHALMDDNPHLLDETEARLGLDRRNGYMTAEELKDCISFINSEGVDLILVPFLVDKGHSVLVEITRKQAGGLSYQIIDPKDKRCCECCSCCCNGRHNNIDEIFTDLGLGLEKDETKYLEQPFFNNWTCGFFVFEKMLERLQDKCRPTTSLKEFLGNTRELLGKRDASLFKFKQEEGSVSKYKGESFSFGSSVFEGDSLLKSEPTSQDFGSCGMNGRVV